MEIAEKLRINALNDGISFTFETVLSTTSKMDFIKQAKEAGYRISTIYVVTSDCNININRIKARVKKGGHDVPTDKVILRYQRCLDLMGEVILLSDDVKIYDNSLSKPVLVFEKKDGEKYLLNREQRHSFIDKYVLLNGDKITEDLDCDETNKR